MKVQIHHNELRPLIKEGYKKVYDGMSKLLAPEEMIFAEWEAGFGDILQWKLPDDYQWRNFTHGDNYDKQTVVNEFLRLKESGMRKLGTNEELKQNVYTIPSESSVYFAVMPDGKYRVMLTAWGYSYPTKPPIVDPTWILPKDTQETTACFIENGNPIANIPVNLHRNGSIYHHKTNEKGEKYFGKLVPGDVLYIEVPSHNRKLTLTVVPGQTVYTFDLTVAPPPVTPDIPKVPVVDPPVPPVIHDNNDDDNDDEPIEIVCDRTVKIQFIGCDGAPIANRNINIAPRGNAGFMRVTDEAGCIYLSNNDLATSNVLKLQVNDAPQQPHYSDCEIVIEEKEDDYAIVFSEKKRSWWWLYLLLFLAAAALAYFTIAFAVTARI